MGRHSNKDKKHKRIDRLDPNTESKETHSDREKRQGRPEWVEIKRRRRRRRNVALGCLAVFFLMATALAVGILIYISGINDRLGSPLELDDAVTELLEQAEPEERGEPFYMLIMGVDNREGEVRARSDTLMVARIDPQEQSVSLVSIPRDTRVVIPGHGTNKINNANALGGPALVIETVKDLTGLPISHYVGVDFNGFKELVDALGGVTVDVPQTIVDPKAGDYDPAAYKIYAGEQTLNGAQALTFVRSRNFPDGDLTRVENQQLFLRAILDEALQIGNALRIKSIIDAAVNNVTTDMSVGELLKLANDMKGMDNAALQTATMPGVPQYVGGVSYVLMDEEAFAAMIERLKTGEPLEVVEGETQSARLPEQITAEVRNGAGINGVAADGVRRLKRAGFNVAEPGNMNQFIYEETLIVHEDDQEAADLVQEVLGIGKVVSSRGMYTFNTDVLVVIGTDWGAPQQIHINNIPIE